MPSRYAVLPLGERCLCDPSCDTRSCDLHQTLIVPAMLSIQHLDADSLGG
jgi:hypothetical protein